MEMIGTENSSEANGMGGGVLCVFCWLGGGRFSLSGRGVWVRSGFGIGSVWVRLQGEQWVDYR